MQIIGHTHLRIGSELEPELGGTLYTALVTALSQIEPPHSDYAISGVFGYKIPENEGIGFFTIQNPNFRVFFLCEGLYGRGIPFLGGFQTSRKIKMLFKRLEEVVPYEECMLAHPTTRDESFWFNLILSLGFGEQIPIEELEVIYPLKYVHIKAKRELAHEVKIEKLETADLGSSLGYGFEIIDILIASKTQGIFSKPQFSFLIYEALFHQIREFVPDFHPNTIVLTYSHGDFTKSQSSLVAFLSLHKDELTIRYCLPMQSGVGIKGTYLISSYLRSLMFNS
jgi:hypothetical protein